MDILTAMSSTFHSTYFTYSSYLAIFLLILVAIFRKRLFPLPLAVFLIVWPYLLTAVTSLPDNYAENTESSNNRDALEALANFLSLTLWTMLIAVILLSLLLLLTNHKSRHHLSTSRQSDTEELDN